MRYGRAMKLAMVAFAAAALRAPATARARTLALNWAETTNSRVGYPATATRGISQRDERV
jgi:hypothetical protein